MPPPWMPWKWCMGSGSQAGLTESTLVPNVALNTAKLIRQKSRTSIVRSVVVRMSKKTVVICDVCGAEVNGTRYDSAQIRLSSPGEYRGTGGQRIDMCIKCYEKFVSFLESGERREGE